MPCCGCHSYRWNIAAVLSKHKIQCLDYCVSCKQFIGILSAFYCIVGTPPMVTPSIHLNTKLFSVLSSACCGTTTSIIIVIAVFIRIITSCWSATHLISPPTAGIVIHCLLPKCQYRQHPFNTVITIQPTSSFQHSLDLYAPDATLKYRHTALYSLSH